MASFLEAKTAFEEISDVEKGLGPRFNGDSCAGCHSHPTIGGTSPNINPQFEMATRRGAMNSIPQFLRQDGPIRVARQVNGPNGQPDGGVVALFTVRGRSDAPNCDARQPNFGRQDNFGFRIPTPVFGMGLMEAIPDQTLRANLAASADRRQRLGIRGRFNSSGNDGTITRFGWKAQNKSILMFSGEAYNVEQGVTNDLFPHERDETPGCVTQASPEDQEDLELFTIFMRFLDQPLRARPASPEDQRRFDGAARMFDQIGCASCHTPTLKSGMSRTAALSNKDVRLFSDLALHNMGRGLADGISQGDAGGGDWRTAPLWGLGQRIFLLHDGRTKDLDEAIRLHGGPGSEATLVIDAYRALPQREKQDLLDFLRSL